VLTRDAQPVLASDIEPALKDWPRNREKVAKALGAKLRGKLANDAANPDDVARKLLDMLDGGGSGGTGRRTAYDELSDELREMLRGKLSPEELHAVLEAIGEADADDEEQPREAQDEDGEDDGLDRNDGALADKIRNLVAGKLTDEDAQQVEECLARLLDAGDEAEGEEQSAEDEPAPFPGQPLAGGEQRPLDTRPTINPKMGGELRSGAAEDSRRARVYKASLESQNRAAFDSRFPGAARLGSGQPQQQYRDGTPVHDARLLDHGPPRSRAPSRSPAMDSRSLNDFAARFPAAAKIKVV
jgi:hypothetical protein